ncbi:class I SAM-dependent methyltransferase [Leptolyngbya sp. ST-U4]|uniref:class I SAM-dependent DNA methyltransferase n=1 Tax=Leptolyngbya sp. ST-U4 TaxID=2933912 RepID=UPI00329709A9
MNVFGNYARYYNLLYRDKDYAGEAQFIHQLLQTHAPNATSILDLGCGTGAHAILLAKQGYQVHGVDLSANMLQQANEQCTQLSADLQARLHFSQADIRQVRIDQCFDVVLSLFHVISYQVTNEDLLAAFKTVKQHLKPGGILIFDAWYGPAVLTHRPTVRVKRMEDEEIQVTRIAEPTLYPNENWVDVNYHIFIRDTKNDIVEELQETHRMRYLFKPEIEFFLQQVGMMPLNCQEWISDRSTGFDSWNVYWIVRK